MPANHSRPKVSPGKQTAMFRLGSDTGAGFKNRATPFAKLPVGFTRAVGWMTENFTQPPPSVASNTTGPIASEIRGRDDGRSSILVFQSTTCQSPIPPQSLDCSCHALRVPQPEVDAERAPADATRAHGT